MAAYPTAPISETVHNEMAAAREAAAEPMPVTVADLLESAAEVMRDKGVQEPERWALAVVAAARNCSTAEVEAQRRATPSLAELRFVRATLDQVSADAPVAYLLGRAPFLGLDFFVSRDTLIPKRDTELFLEIIFDQAAADPLPANPHVLELCCGSGCVAVTLAKRLPGSRVVATDISPEALAIARANVAEHAANVVLGEGDLWSPVAALMGDRPFDLIVSNPPYIPTEQIPGMGRHVADHEPHLALDGGEDGLDPHRRILERAAEFLAPGGRVFLEHEYYHGQAGRELAARYPEFTDVRTFADANGKDRALYVRRRA